MDGTFRRHRGPGLLALGLVVAVVALGSALRPAPLHAQTGGEILGDGGPIATSEVRLNQQTNTYTRPDPTSPIQATLGAGAIVEGISTQTGTDGALWEQVTKPDGTALGWMRLADFLAGTSTIFQGGTAIEQATDLFPGPLPSGVVPVVPTPFLPIFPVILP